MGQTAPTAAASVDVVVILGGPIAGNRRKTVSVHDVAILYMMTLAIRRKS
jgi:hypothetical protein